MQFCHRNRQILWFTVFRSSLFSLRTIKSFVGFSSIVWSRSVSSSEKIEGYDVCGLHVYHNWTAKNLYIAKFGRAKRVPCESAGETPNGITYTSTHQRIVLAVGPIIFEVRSSGLIL